MSAALEPNPYHPTGEVRVTAVHLDLNEGAVSAGVIARFDFICGFVKIRGARLQRHGVSKQMTVFLPQTRFEHETVRFLNAATRARVVAAAEVAVAAAIEQRGRAVGWEGKAHD